MLMRSLVAHMYIMIHDRVKWDSNLLGTLTDMYSFASVWVCIFRLQLFFSVYIMIANITVDSNRQSDRVPVDPPLSRSAPGVTINRTGPHRTAPDPYWTTPDPTVSAPDPTESARIELYRGFLPWGFVCTPIKSRYSGLNIFNMYRYSVVSIP